MVKSASTTEVIEKKGMSPDDFRRDVTRISEIATYQLEVPTDLDARLEKETKSLLVDIDTARSAAVALLAGHLVLQGPPGTGKTSLSRALCRAFDIVPLVVTAHEGWTPYDVVGRQELRVNAGGTE